LLPIRPLFDRGGRMPRCYVGLRGTGTLDGCNSIRLV
jgi:hypothetical protein